MTIQNTPIYALPYPQGGDPADAPSQLQALANRIETVLSPVDTQSKAKDTTIGLLSARPAFGTAGRRYFATDVVADYVDTGTAWLRTSIAAGVTAAILTAGAPTGWRSCDGATITNTGVTADLYTAIGATLPDLRGRTVVGIAAVNVPASGDPVRTVKAKGGVTAVTLTAAQSGAPAHSHAIYPDIYGSMLNTPGNPLNTVIGDHHVLRTDTSFEAQGPDRMPGSTGITNTVAAVNASAEHDNMTPFQVLNWIVKL